MIPVHRYPSLALFVVLTAFSLWVLYLAPRSAIHRLFALFLAARALPSGLLAFGNRETAVIGTLVPHAFLVVPFLAYLFVHKFREEHGTTSKATMGRHRLIVGAALAALELALFLWPDLYYKGDQPGPLSVVIPATYLSFAYVAHILASAWFRAPRATDRLTLRLLTLGFIVEPFYFSILRTIDLYDAVRTEQYFLVPGGVLNATTFGFAAALIARVALQAPREGPQSWPAVRWFAIVLAPAAALAVGVAWLEANASRTIWATSMLTVDAVLIVVLVVLAAYSIFKYELFGLDLRAKVIVKQATVTALFAASFFIVSESLERLFDIKDVAVGLLTAALISFSLRPLQAVSQRIAERLFPGVTASPEYFMLRKTEVYRATYETLTRDRVLSRADRAVLERLKDRLELPGPVAARVENEVIGMRPGRATGRHGNGA